MAVLVVATGCVLALITELVNALGAGGLLTLVVAVHRLRGRRRE